MIHLTIVNDFIKIKLNDRNGETKNEIGQKLILQVCFCKILIDMLKQNYTDFSMAYGKKELVRFSDSAI